MNIFITGIGGFVGTYLAQACETAGHTVKGLDTHPCTHPGAVQADILDNVQLTELLKGMDWIIHLAAQSSAKNSFDSPELTFSVNVEGTRNLIEASPENARILIVSSSDVYGTCSESVTEEAPVHPVTPYGKSRVAQEALVKEYPHKDIIISRSFTHTGPGQRDTFVCSDFAKQVAEVEQGKRDKIKTGNLDIERDFSDVRDIVKAYLLLLEKGKPTVYNVCSGKTYKLRDILNTLITLSSASIQSEEEKGRIRPQDVFRSAGISDKIFKDTGWKTTIPFPQTLQDLLTYWREHIV